MIEKLKAAFRFISEAEAVAAGFTHHGKYCGIPIYVAGDHFRGIEISVKWKLLDYIDVISLIAYVEMITRYIIGDERGFRFLIGEKLK